MDNIVRSVGSSRQVITIKERAPDFFVSLFPELPSTVAHLLYQRGLTNQQEVDAFLHPEYQQLHDPFLFEDMRKACERIYQAIENNERIAIHGDYDADGVSASVILETVLRTLGAETMVFLPHREKDGYGLNSQTINHLHEHKVNLIITCDCGISNTAEIDLAKSFGIDVIVSDHHAIPEQIPDAVAIIHPKMPNETYPFKLLAGGGVAFKIAQALVRMPQCMLTDQQKEICEKWLLDLVALSTVADMVELIGENRVLVKFGLIVMSKNKRLGVQKLLATAAIDPLSLTTTTISFQIAPRINAAGRMDHANAAYQLLVSESEAEATHYATLIERQNKERQKTTDKMYSEAITEAETQSSKSIMVYRETWSAGLTGLVAGKLTKAFHKPAFVFCHDGTKIVGSGRGIEGVDILNAVVQAKDLLISYGGHPQACGLRFETAHYNEVVNILSSYFQRALPDDLLSPVINIDVEASLDEITWSLLDCITDFEPFGQGNHQPIFVTRNVFIEEQRQVGAKGAHLKLQLSQGNKRIPGIAFDRPLVDYGQTPCTIVYSPTINEWNGNREIQLVVKEIIIENEK